jgi:sigma-B regulation protein RsbU (phosphoserine phosphatase)
VLFRSDRPAPPALRTLAEAARASGSALAVSQAAHMPESLSAGEREALEAFLPIVVAPVQVQGALVGAVAVGQPITPGPYMSFAAKLLYGGTAMANGLLLRARMIHEAEAAASLRREMEVARRIQQSLRPRAPLALPAVSAWGWCREATMVGGDMYGWWTPEAPHQPVWCYIGDVSGHGVGPALLMSNAYAVLRALCREEATAAAVADRLNALLCEDIEQAMEYLTLSLMRIDPVAGELHYVGLGHPPVLLLGAGEESPVWLEGDGLPAGLFSGETYQSATVRLQPGDLLVAYTDGITEPENAYGEMFGEERLMDLLVKYQNADAAEIIARSIEAVKLWAASPEQEDDMTMVVARRIAG